MQTYSRRTLIRTLCVGALLGTAIAPMPTWAEPKFQDPLDLPAQMRNGISTRPMLSVARAGDALVAVGSRGLIMRSADQGKTWTQSAVPVQSDLLAVHFPNPSDGWAVGHDGVILHTSDGGKSWTKQLDGRIASGVFKQYYGAGAADPATQAAASQIERNFKAGPTLPWLDVWFDDADRGFVVGSFGMIAATVDGGKTWEPWLHRIDNEKGLNLNAVRGLGGNLYIVGEHGMVYQLDRANRRFRKTATGYAGSFFGIVGNANSLLAFGLRGVVYRSDDGGSRWEALKMPADATVTSGAVNGDAGNFVLVNSAGQFLIGDRDGRSFKVVHAASPMRYTGLALINHTAAVVTGLDGARTEMLSGTGQ